MDPGLGCQSNNAVKLFRLSKLDSNQQFQSYLQKRGCRFYCDSKNSMLYSYNFEFTNAFCEREKDDFDYCNQIVEIINRDGAVKIAALVGTLGFLWSTMMAPIWSALSKPTSVKSVKTIITKVQKLKNATSDTVISDLKGNFYFRLTAG